MHKQWIPIEDGWVFHSDETMSLTVQRNGGTLRCTDYILAEESPVVSNHHLENNVRLCRLVETTPLNQPNEEGHWIFRGRWNWSEAKSIWTDVFTLTEINNEYYAQNGKLPIRYLHGEWYKIIFPWEQ